MCILSALLPHAHILSYVPLVGDVGHILGSLGCMLGISTARLSAVEKPSL